MDTIDVSTRLSTNICTFLFILEEKEAEEALIDDERGGL